MKVGFFYEAPDMAVVEICSEGVLCSSLDMNPEDGNMW